MIEIKIKCPNCGFRETKRKKFIRTEVHCEDCGTHDAIKCPKCEEIYDSIYDVVCIVCGLIFGSYEDCPEHGKYTKARFSEVRPY